MRILRFTAMAMMAVSLLVVSAPAGATILSPATGVAINNMGGCWAGDGACETGQVVAVAPGAGVAIPDSSLSIGFDEIVLGASLSLIHVNVSTTDASFQAGIDPFAVPPYSGIQVGPLDVQLADLSVGAVQAGTAFVWFTNNGTPLPMGDAQAGDPNKALPPGALAPHPLGLGFNVLFTGTPLLQTSPIGAAISTAGFNTSWVGLKFGLELTPFDINDMHVGLFIEPLTLPEPSSLVLLALALGGVAGLRNRS